MTHSLPALNATTLAALEAILLEQFEYPALPQDYRDFLLKHNGGHVEPGYGQSQRKPAQQVVFDTPLQWVRLDNKPVKPALVTFFGAWLPAHTKLAPVERSLRR